MQFANTLTYPLLGDLGVTNMVTRYHSTSCKKRSGWGFLPTLGSIHTTSRTPFMIRSTCSDRARAFDPHVLECCFVVSRVAATKDPIELSSYSLFPFQTDPPVLETQTDAGPRLQDHHKHMMCSCRGSSWRFLVRSPGGCGPAASHHMAAQCEVGSGPL